MLIIGRKTGHCQHILGHVGSGRRLELEPETQTQTEGYRMHNCPIIPGLLKRLLTFSKHDLPQALNAICPGKAYNEEN